MSSPNEPVRPAARWSREVRIWDRVVYIALAANLILGVATGGDPSAQFTTSRIVPLISTIAIGAAYALLGSRASRNWEQRSKIAANTYLAILGLSLVAAAATGSVSAILFSVAAVHIWMLAGSDRAALWWTGAVSFFVFAAFWLRGDQTFAGVISVLPSLVWTFAFSGGIGWLISRQQSQTERNAELYDQLQATQAALLAAQHDAGVAAERERLAGEIHDTLAQGFTSIIMQTQVATSALNRGDSDAVSERLGIVDAVARENLAEARGLVAAFAPVALQGASICEALQRLGSRFAAETGIRVIVETDSSCDIPADVEIVILRATQEALNNIRRHSGATAATIRLNHGDNPGIVLLEIADNGIGIPDDVAAGFGLTGMNNRITEIGGSLQIKPTYANPGSSSNPGTTLSITLPLPLN